MGYATSRDVASSTSWITVGVVTGLLTYGAESVPDTHGPRPSRMWHTQWRQPRDVGCVADRSRSQWRSPCRTLTGLPEHHDTKTLTARKGFSGVVRPFSHPGACGVMSQRRQRVDSSRADVG